MTAFIKSLKDKAKLLLPQSKEACEMKLSLPQTTYLHESFGEGVSLSGEEGSHDISEKDTNDNLKNDGDGKDNGNEPLSCETASQYSENGSEGDSSRSETLSPDNIFFPGAQITPHLTIISKAGSGGFGIVWKMSHKVEGQQENLYAIKVSNTEGQNDDLNKEIFVLNQMKESKYFCKAFAFGNMYGRSVLVMTLLGDSLSSIRKSQGQKNFDIGTVAALGIECLEAIRHLHSRKLIHHDIKGSNFATGVGPDARNIYLIDFGLTEPNIILKRDVDEWAEKAVEKCNSFCGTRRYASPFHNGGYDQTYRDDIFSYFYMLVEFLKGSLPWSNLPSKATLWFQVRLEKQLLTHLPLEFLHIYNHIKGLEFEDIPDYDLIKSYLLIITERQKRLGLDDPLKYDKYKNIPIEQLASDAVFEQAAVAKNQPKTGNRLIDMLHENGIPIGSSLKGIEQALRTQKEIENNDPTEQIAKAVFDKFQKQILPGLVANMIAGKNPFQMPNGQMPRVQAAAPSSGGANLNEPPVGTELTKHFQETIKKNMERLQTNQFAMNPLIAERLGVNNNVRKAQPKSDVDDDYVDESTEVNAEKELNQRLHDQKQHDEREPAPKAEHKFTPNDFKETEETENFDDVFKARRRPRRAAEWNEAANRMLQNDPKTALLFGLNEMNLGEESEEVESKRKSPLDLTTQMKKELEPMMTADEINYQLSDPEQLLAPLKPLTNPNPQPGFVIPRKIPKRPRKMLPLMIGVQNPDALLFPQTDNNNKINGKNSVKLPMREEGNIYVASKEVMEPKNPFAERRRFPIHEKKVYQMPRSRVLDNLKNNPGLIALFEDTDLAEKLDKPSVLSPQQRGLMNARGNSITTYPRMYAAKIFGEEPTSFDKKTKQVVEEREIPPVLFMGKGQHTRLQWSTATEQEIPGIGTRMIVPSLDPTRPAINSVMSTQGKERNEYETMWKIPNNWEAGDIFGIKLNSKSEKMIGANNLVDFPALGRDTMFG
uniref:Protein kinase domain-containing protein n=1 Tax=Rhabditophanes sp. KR3021 TaxID=114890 RepID=A0AC35TGQ6_9BILA